MKNISKLMLLAGLTLQMSGNLFADNWSDAIATYQPGATSQAAGAQELLERNLIYGQARNIVASNRTAETLAIAAFKTGRTDKFPSTMKASDVQAKLEELAAGGAAAAAPAPAAAAAAPAAAAAAAAAAPAAAAAAPAAAAAAAPAAPAAAAAAAPAFAAEDQAIFADYSNDIENISKAVTAAVNSAPEAVRPALREVVRKDFNAVVTAGGNAKRSNILGKNNSKKSPKKRYSKSIR